MAAIPTPPESSRTGSAPTRALEGAATPARRSAGKMETETKALGALNERRKKLVKDLTELDIRPIKNASILFGDKTWKKALCAFGAVFLFPFVLPAVMLRRHVLHKAEALYAQAVTADSSEQQKRLLVSAEETLEGSWTTRELGQYPLAERIKVLLREGSTEASGIALRKFDDLPAKQNLRSKIHLIHAFFIGIGEGGDLAKRYKALQFAKKDATDPNHRVFTSQLNHTFIEQCNVAAEQIIEAIKGRYEKKELISKGEKLILLFVTPTPLSTQYILELVRLGELTDDPGIMTKAQEAAKTPLDHERVRRAIIAAYPNVNKRPTEISELYSTTNKAWDEFPTDRKEYVECFFGYQAAQTPEQARAAIEEMKKLADNRNSEAQKWLGDYYRDRYYEQLDPNLANRDPFYVPGPHINSAFRQAVKYYNDFIGSNTRIGYGFFELAKLRAAKCKELSDKPPDYKDSDSGRTRTVLLDKAITAYEDIPKFVHNLSEQDHQAIKSVLEALTKEHEACMKTFFPSPPET